MGEQGIQRLNWGCGDCVQPGWVNSDVKEGPGIVQCDIHTGLPFDDNWFDYAVTIHALPEIPYNDLLPALRELRRVLKPGGVLRVSLPDLEKGMDAYRRGNISYFVIPDEDMESIGGKLVTQLVWYGHSRTLFVRDFVEELLRKAEFRDVRHVVYGRTSSRHAEIVELDNREAESLFVEAVK